MRRGRYGISILRVRTGSGRTPHECGRDPAAGAHDAGADRSDQPCWPAGDLWSTPREECSCVLFCSCPVPGRPCPALGRRGPGGRVAGRAHRAAAGQPGARADPARGDRDRPAAGRAVVGPLPPARRVRRGPSPGGGDGAGQGGRRLPAGRRSVLRGLRGADDPGRAAPPLPRRGLERTAAPPPAGARARPRRGDREPDPAAAAYAPPGRARGRRRRRRGRGSPGPAGGPVLPGAVGGVPGRVGARVRRPGRRVRAAVRPDGAGTGAAAVARPAPGDRPAPVLGGADTR